MRCHNYINRHFGDHKQGNKVHATDNLFGAVLRHSDEALLVSFVDLRDLVVVLFQLVDELRRVKHTVGASRFQDLALLRLSEVLPLE